MQFSCGGTVFQVRRDEGGDGNGARVGKELGNFADAADVFVAVGFAEAEVFVEAEADVVAWSREKSNLATVGGRVVEV